MSDHFEQAKDDILLRTDGNGGPTTRDLLIALQALAADNDDGCSNLARIIEENHAETRALAARNLNLIETHLREDVRMSNEEFHDFINGFAKRHADRDAIVAELHSEVEQIKQNCQQLHQREPRRRGDPLDVDYSGEDEELGSMRRVWRIVRYILLAAAAAGLIFWMDTLSRWFSYSVLNSPN